MPMEDLVLVLQDVFWVEEAKALKREIVKSEVDEEGDEDQDQDGSGEAVKDRSREAVEHKANKSINSICTLHLPCGQTKHYTPDFMVLHHCFETLDPRPKCYLQLGGLKVTHQCCCLSGWQS